MTATLALVIALASAYLVGWLQIGHGGWFEALAFTGFARPWGMLTYPFAYGGADASPFFVFFELAWLYIVGLQVEARYGIAKFLALFFGGAASAAILGGIVTSAMPGRAALAGPWVAVSVLTCVWAAMDPLGPVRLMFCIPSQRRWLALLVGVSVVLIYGAGQPVFGLAVALPCAAAWLVVRRTTWLVRKSTVVSGRGQKAQSTAEFDDFITKVRERERVRKDQERLRKLIEGGDDDQEAH